MKTKRKVVTNIICEGQSIIRTPASGIKIQTEKMQPPIDALYFRPHSRTHLKPIYFFNFTVPYLFLISTRV